MCFGGTPCVKAQRGKKLLWTRHRLFRTLLNHCARLAPCVAFFDSSRARGRGALPLPFAAGLVSVRGPCRAKGRVVVPPTSERAIFSLRAPVDEGASSSSAATSSSSGDGVAPAMGAPLVC